MEAKYNFDNSLKVTYKAFYLAGISISPKDTNVVRLALKCLFFFNLTWLYIDLLAEFYCLIDGIHVGKSCSELSLIAPPVCICLLATVKTAPLFYYRHLCREVIIKLQKIHPKNYNGDSTNIFESKNHLDTKLSNLNEDTNVEKTDNDAEEKENASFETEDFITDSAIPAKVVEKEIFTSLMRALNILTNLLVVIAVAVVILFVGTPVTAMAYEYHTKKTTELKLPYLTKYFFDPFTTSRWPLVYLHQAWSTLIVCFNLFGAETFLYVFCIYMQIHFRILCHHYTNVVCKSSEETWERLVHLIKRHQELIRLVDQVEILYSKSTLFNIVVSSILICLCGFNVAFNDDLGAVVSFSSFLVLNISQTFLLCFFGDMLMMSSTKVSEAIYKCRWYDTDQRTKTTLLCILTRAQKPCKLTASNYADLNLSVFKTIMSTSWSYFTLLRTMYD